jgi:hypothetical protein
MDPSFSMEEYKKSQGSFAGGFLVWITTLEKMLTLDNLRKMNVMVVK